METKLKKYLNDNNIKLTEFAQRLNYQKGNLSRIVNGKMQPSFRIALKIQEQTNNFVMPIDLKIIKNNQNTTPTNYPPASNA
jgi:transcriptional regulator with XRE-family HTH domain